MDKNNFVAIMAGGIGSRFWPASRSNMPKQFLDILGTGKTLIRSTFERFLKICPAENIYILTNLDYIDLVKEQLPEIGDDQILGEPLRKNTAPCIAYVSHKIQKKNPKANIIVAPSDHIILDEASYVKTSLHALDFVSRNHALVTLGILPSRPDTGYGYIQFLEPEVEEGINKVKTFTEKPDIDTAKRFIASGEFLWNAGIFVWNVNTILEAFENLLPDVNDTFVEIIEDLGTNSEQAAIERAFLHCPSISVDFGIMEKAQNVYVLPSEFGWSDLGTWASLHAEMKKDSNQNAVKGENVKLYNSSENMITVPKDKLVVVQGLKNFIVVDTGDVLMICDKDNEQDIKKITQNLKKLKSGQHLI
ncbi:MAG: mannose-1-phosphate guanylyltransferase [Bacteroidetes bacterium]|nr:mannose-1-phosphate guanylyltransferase [Bacteroidota bacterium]